MSRSLIRSLAGKVCQAHTLRTKSALLCHTQAFPYSTAHKTTSSKSPATGQVIAEHRYLTNTEAAAMVEKSHGAFKSWKGSSFADRAQVMRNAAAVLRQRRDEYAELIANEMGKPIKEGRGEVEKCALVCEYYAENAAKFLADEPVPTQFQESFVTFQPLGVVLIVMPWNFPFWQVFRQAACALSAGNTMLLKHASNVFGCAAAIEGVFQEAGLPDGVFLNLPISGGQCGAVLEHKYTRAVALTGSTPVGKSLGAHAGRLVKKAVLELGGSDPYLILDDADVELAATACTSGRILNCGQSCVGAKRFIVMEAVYDEFIERFTAKMAATKVGDPLSLDTDMGPMVDPKSRAEVHQQVQDTVQQGAQLLLGGQPIDGPEGTAFYPPTILAGVQKGMRAYEEEIFGPVATVIKVKDEAEAIFVANDTPFGLGSAVFTRDEAKGRRIAAEELEVGMAFVNDFVKSDPRLPFGGAKESGLGRECSHYGIKEFVNVKTVVVK